LSDWVFELAKAKINLSLHVLGRRTDGYHELDSHVAFADCGDELWVRPAAENSYIYDGPYAAQLPAFENNIIFKAWQQAKIIVAPHGVALPCVEIKLIKNLPVASGIGGGSADAAAMLRALFKMVAFEISPNELSGLAKSLGADVPVCFKQVACRMQGIGEVVTAFEVGPGAQSILLVNPNLPCSTADVFKTLGLVPGQLHKCAQGGMHNDLTEPAVLVQPAIRIVMEVLKNYFKDVRMSGSGATCFAIGENFDAVEKIQKAHPEWWVKATKI
jgi:4-diphosphocytidyl-2-C-methyl-D-erythritol kinase